MSQVGRTALFWQVPNGTIPAFRERMFPNSDVFGAAGTPVRRHLFARQVIECQGVAASARFPRGFSWGALAPFDSIPYLSVAFQIRLIEIDDVGYPSHDSET